MPGAGGRRGGGRRGGRRGYHSTGGGNRSARQTQQAMLTNQMHMMVDPNEVATVEYWARRQGVLSAVNPNAAAPPEPTSGQIDKVMEQFDENYTGSSYCISQPVLDIMNMLAVLIALAKCGIQIYTAIKFQSGDDTKEDCRSYFIYNIIVLVLAALGVILYGVIRSGACACYNDSKQLQSTAGLTMTTSIIILNVLPTVATMTLARGGECFKNAPLKDDRTTVILFWVGVGLDGLLLVIVGVSLITWGRKSSHMNMISMMQHIPPNLRHYYARTTPGIKSEMRNYFLAKSKMPEGDLGTGAMGMATANPQFATMTAAYPQIAAMAAENPQIAAMAAENPQISAMAAYNQPQTFGMSMAPPPDYNSVV